MGFKVLQAYEHWLSYCIITWITNQFVSDLVLYVTPGKCISDYYISNTRTPLTFKGWNWRFPAFFVHFHVFPFLFLLFPRFLVGFILAPPLPLSKKVRRPYLFLNSPRSSSPSHPLHMFYNKNKSWVNPTCKMYINTGIEPVDSFP